MTSDQPVGSTDQKTDAICCAEFNPALWDNKFHNWQDKLFVRGQVRAFFHLPLNMGQVYPRMCQAIEAAGAMPPASEFLGLFRDSSLWKTEANMTVTKEVPGLTTATISGHFFSRVFDGPYKDMGKFYKAALEEAKTHGREPGRVYFHYAYCPKCAKKYGHNYMVAFVEEK